MYKSLQRIILQYSTAQYVTEEILAFSYCGHHVHLL